MAGNLKMRFQKLLAYVGTGERSRCFHCVTRMRFVLNDPSKADTSAIEALPPPRDIAGRTVQVIIGNEDCRTFLQ